MTNQPNDQLLPAETPELLHLAEQALTADGDFVELGCYRGDTSVFFGQLLQKSAPPPPNLVENSAKSVHNPVENPVEKPVENSKTKDLKSPKFPKSLWIYDSFAGLPEKTAEDSSGAGAHFQKGALAVTKREVIDKLKKHGLKLSSAPTPQHSSVIVKKAWFDQLTPHDLPERIAFAFCDGDLYNSIKTSLALVAPRLSERGIIVVHDYANPELPGSTRAVDEFLLSHPNFRLTRRHTLAILTPK